jgi:glycosyltransferase involved in cell wall biosynthesis
VIDVSLEQNISVLILTLDEEINISSCIESLNWCNDIVVLDSFSNDKTVEVSKQKGARVFQREFDDYANQRNYGLSEIEYHNSWLLMVDADEVITVELANEMKEAVKSAANNISLYRMRRKDYFLGKWIRRSSGYPTWFGRLMKIGEVSVEREINEEYITAGKVESLQHHLHHYPFNKGFSCWLQKHDRYSSMEAEQKLKENKKIPFRNILNADPTVRRKCIKQIAYSLPCRPLVMFVALYFIRGGILEGRAGFIFCLLRAYYEFMIDCKYLELKRRLNGKTI